MDRQGAWVINGDHFLETYYEWLTASALEFGFDCLGLFTGPPTKLALVGVIATIGATVRPRSDRISVRVAFEWADTLGLLAVFGTNTVGTKLTFEVKTRISQIVRKFVTRIHNVCQYQQINM